ncbi:MAG: PilZ domain-containing protein [Gemmatales bacterium]|nr:PilZ domain-containing protein [Gemmatales bacterium]MDW8387393.1 PilZ domain-containing protein [Gemmatales bacterium]
MSSFVPTGPVSLTSFSERRAKVRYTCRVKSTWRPLGSPDTAWDALVQDVSETGLRLLVGTQQKRGTILSVNLECGQERFSKGILVKVVQCRSQEGGLWSVGCSFIKPLKEKELLALLHASADVGAELAAPNPSVSRSVEAAARSSAVPTRHKREDAHATEEVSDAHAKTSPVESPSPMGGAEKRRAPRRGSNLAVVQITRPGAWSKSVEGWVVNKSLGGMCLCSPRKFEEDTILEVRPKRSSGTDLTLEMRVVHVRQEGTRYMLHCQFTRHAAPHILRQFT